jgi:uncharacterized protein with ParB-like and HNH nuclease domain
MNRGKYNLKEFLAHRDLDQIIIPEIQRDYVWQKDNVKKFLESILENSIRQNDSSKEITEELFNKLPTSARKAIIRDQEENTVYCNIGFIYAYPDPQMPNRYILIDGQQRMTTLFLILLKLSIKDGQQDNFKREYFKDKNLKLDYKVREETHEFLLKFVQYVLDSNNIADISNKYWNFTEYKNDKTIQSIIDNYQVISDFIDKNDLPLDYVENYIEFWYFNTNDCQQGEELYLYLNSRGETISPNESIKANLLKKYTIEKEKNDWGKKWEQWQNLFWKKRKTNSNADSGIEEFLKWIKFVEITKSNKDSPKTGLGKTLRDIKETKKINIVGLTLQKIESYINALEKLIKLENELKFNLNWLTGNINYATEYIKLIPMLMYAEKYPSCNDIEIKRFARFFLNIAHFDKITKEPYNSIVDVIFLTDHFLEKGFTDITDIASFSKSFENILTDEEIAKLSIYKQSPNDLRQKIENAFWQAEDYKLCDGKIGLIFKCIDFDESNPSSFDIDKLLEFNVCFDNFKTLFDNPDDWVRRALLTKGDYKVGYGSSPKLGLYKYSFINEDSLWKRQLSSKRTVKPYISLINDFGQRKKVDNAVKNDILDQIITDFLKNKTEKDWIYYFVKEPSILGYCWYKTICWSDDIEKIALLQAINVNDYNWCWLKDKIKIEK